MKRARILLLHWISLDAVVVLLAYQWALGRWVGAELPASAHVFLAPGIWLGYTADRLLDLKRRPGLASATLRHAFLARHRRTIRLAWLIVAAGVAVLAPFLLPLRHLAAGALFLVLASLYLALAAGTAGHPARFPAAAKRIATVGLLTLSGAWWFLGDPRQFHASGVWVMALFAGAAWWNLKALTRGGDRDRRSLAVDGAVLATMLVVGALAP